MAKILGNRYFSPQREALADLVLCSNIALMPDFRVSMMSDVANKLAGAADCAQWRYDQLNNMLQASYGAMDLAEATRIITFLSPDRHPGYWNITDWPDNPNPSNPMTAMVEGSLSVVDLKRRIMLTKGGYWKDEFVRVTLPSYIVK